MDRDKICKICRLTMSINEFKKKGKNKWCSYCKRCKAIRDEMLKVKQIEMPILETESDIEVRGEKPDGRKYSFVVSYEKAKQMINEKTCYIVHSRLIKKYFTKEHFRELIFERYGGACFYCGGMANTIDHIIPKSKGGISSISNCLPSCLDCNMLKGDMGIDDFLYYYDPYPNVPITEVELTRCRLIELTNQLNHYKNYLNRCLKRIGKRRNIFDEMVELEEVEKKLGELIETVKGYREKRHEKQKHSLQKDRVRQ